MSEKTKDERALAKRGETALAVPEDMKDHLGHGTEGIGAGDVRPPRLALAQGGSKQVKKNEESYIEGLAEGDLFNDLTNAIYEPPVKFVVVRYLGRRAVEYYSDEEKKKTGQIVKDRAVELDDHRCQSTTDAAGAWVKPIADIFADYLVFLPDTTEIVSLTFKNADLSRNGAATQLNSLMKYILKLDDVVLTNTPAWARTFQLGSAGKSDGVYNWAVHTMKLVGVTPVEMRKIAANIFDDYQAANVVIEEPEDAPETHTDEAPAAAKVDDDVPF